MSIVKMFATDELEKARKVKGFSQREFVEIINLCIDNGPYTQAAYARWENKSRAADLSIARAICNILERPVSELWSVGK